MQPLTAGVGKETGKGHLRRLRARLRQGTNAPEHLRLGRRIQVSAADEGRQDAGRRWNPDTRHLDRGVRCHHTSEFPSSQHRCTYHMKESFCLYK